MVEMYLTLSLKVQPYPDSNHDHLGNFSEFFAMNMLLNVLRAVNHFIEAGASRHHYENVRQRRRGSALAASFVVSCAYATNRSSKRGRRRRTGEEAMGDESRNKKSIPH